MSAKRAFLVLAPESHGNHLVTDLLVHAGCVGESGGHVDWRPDATELGPDDEKPWESATPTDGQPWDVSPPTDEDPIVWRRSVPHGGQWLDLESMVAPLRERGYVVRAIVVTRERYAAVRSQLKWHHVDTADEARANIARAYPQIFDQLERAKVPFVVTSYEALSRNESARTALLTDLGLDPADGFEAWDGNAKWESFAAAEPTDTEEPELDTGFPETWFPAPEYLLPEYEKRLRIGRDVMAKSRVLFCGLARDIERLLPSALGRIALAGEGFAEFRAVIYENDSTDGTRELLAKRAGEEAWLDVISEDLGTPRWGSTRDPERMAQMAACRNRLLEHARSHYADFDYLIMLDLDLLRGFSYDGLIHAFGYEGWDWIGANGVSAPFAEDATDDLLFYDAWAFRWPGDEAARPADEINALRFHRGGPPVAVWSCFGGLAIYRMEAIRSGARYSGDDCEHVTFHRALREGGFGLGFLDPSLLVLYSVEQ